MKVAIIGSNGFLGANLSKFLKEKNIYVREIQRKSKNNVFQINSIGRCNNWDEALKEIDIVVHCAGIAHIINRDKNIDIVNTFDLINTNLEGTINLTKSCIKNNIKQLIFISSIKVLGEKNSIDKPFTNYSCPDPKDIYAWSKLKSEEAIKELCNKTRTKYTIIRPPLLFGPGVKANFERLIKLVELQIPLPFGSLKNRRSIMKIENLANFIHKCITSKESENQTFVVSDLNDYSIEELIKYIALTVRKKVIVFKFPKTILKLLFYLIGRSKEFKKLSETLLINPLESYEIMNLNPKLYTNNSLKNKLKTFNE